MGRLIPLNPLEVYERGLHDPESLSGAERLVYILIELETCSDMEGWDYFFTTDKMRYYADLKSGLLAAGDLDSIAVLEDYEQELRKRNVPFEPEAIHSFHNQQNDAYFQSSNDWRLAYSNLAEIRWAKVAAHVRRAGRAMD